MVSTSRVLRTVGGVALGGLLLGACSLGGGSSTTNSTTTTVNSQQTTFRTIPFTTSTTAATGSTAPGAGGSTTVPGGGEGVYTVKAGDAWLSIARKLGVDATALAEFNGKALTDALFPGEQLKIPPKTAGSTTTVSGATASTSAGSGSTPTTSKIAVAGTYTVVAGDYWVGIARKLGVDYNALLQVNGATASTPLYPGQTLKVPAKKASGSSSTTTSKATTTTAKP